MNVISRQYAHERLDVCRPASQSAQQHINVETLVALKFTPKRNRKEGVVHEKPGEGPSQASMEEAVGEAVTGTCAAAACAMLGAL